MIDLYDGNNVMRRAMEKPIVGGPSPMSLRLRYETMAAAKPFTQFWVWDGRHHNERRRAIYPKYKMNREPTPEDIFAQIRLWRELVVLAGPIVQIEVPGWEADDVIGTLVRDFSKRGVPTRVHTNDMDYAQLQDLPGVTLNGVNTKDVPARWVPLFKAMVGDKSDNIDGIPGFGPGRWDQMSQHWPQIERAIVNGDPAGFVGLPFKPAVASWLVSEDNVKLLQSMLAVTHFENVPKEDIDKGTVCGIHDRERADARLREFFL